VASAISIPNDVVVISPSVGALLALNVFQGMGAVGTVRAGVSYFAVEGGVSFRF
jgi:hypothetical protein